MGFDQIIVLTALLIGSGAAVVKDRWLVVIVMWMNFGSTLALYSNPLAVGVLDISCVAVLLRFGSRRDYIVVCLFVAMICSYRFEEQLGRVALYDIVNVLACLQCIVIGGGGFGELFRNVRFTVFGVHSVDRGDIVVPRSDNSGNIAINLDRDKKRVVSE